VIGDGVSVSEQSFVFEHLRDCVPFEKQGDHPEHSHVSSVHSGVQLCVVPGSGSFTVAQSFVFEHVRDCVPASVHADQLEQSNVSDEQLGDPPPPPPPPPPLPTANATNGNTNRIERTMGTKRMLRIKFNVMVFLSFYHLFQRIHIPLQCIHLRHLADLCGFCPTDIWIVCDVRESFEE